MASLLRRVLERRRVGRRKRRRRRRRAENNTDADIERFREWCEETGIFLHQSLAIGRESSVAGVGVLATADITRGTVLARIPRASLLNAANSAAVSTALASDTAFQRQLKRSGNSWLPLLLALLAEHQQQSSSFWWPYLSLVPSESSPGSAHQWLPEERRQLLQGSGVGERVERDLANIKKDHCEIILPFLQRHPEFFKESCHSLQLYKELVCFVMSYSFSDPEEEDVCRQTMMVPFVDLLNHHSSHQAELRFLSTHLQLVAVTHIPQGSEVMNTYGHLSNASLVHEYGFAEEGNPHDVALIQFSTLWEMYRMRGEATNDVLCRKRWQMVREDVEDDEFEVDLSGQPHPALLAAVKLLVVKKKRYERMRELVMDGEDELSVASLTELEREFLQKVVRASLARLPQLSSGPEEELQKMADKELFARRLTQGQRLCLERLLDQIIRVGGL